MNTIGIYTQYDAHAWAFVNAAALTSVTQSNAINTLCLNLKVANLWNRFQAIYPVIGGSATTHKFNLKDPRDVDAAFRLTFSGTITHNSSGMAGNGLTGWADTKYNPRTSASLNDHSISVYIGNNVALEASYDVGCYDGTTENALITRYNNNLVYQSINTTSFNTAASTDSRGYFMASRTASNATTTYRNGSAIIATQTTASTNTPNFNYSLMASNRSPLPISYSTKRIQFATIGASLNSTEANTMYGIVQTYQTALSRNV